LDHNPVNRIILSNYPSMNELVNVYNFINDYIAYIITADEIGENC